MFKNIRWESFVWIIVWVFILWFVLLAIVNLLIFATESSTGYSEDNRVTNIRENAYSILEKSDLSNISSGEEIYFYKNSTGSTYNILTWAINIWYQYIDAYGNHIPDISVYDDTIYILKWIIHKKDSLSGEEDILYNINASIY